MDTLTNNPFDLGFNECANINVVRLTDGNERFVDFWIELGSNVFAIECHLCCGLIAKVCGEFFDVRNARILYFSAGDFLNGPDRNAAAFSNARPLPLRVLKLI